MDYLFYGWESAVMPAVNHDYHGIRTPQQLYDALKEIWCADTCAPRLRARELRLGLFPVGILRPENGGQADLLLPRASRGRAG